MRNIIYFQFLLPFFIMFVFSTNGGLGVVDQDQGFSNTKTDEQISDYENYRTSRPAGYGMEKDID